MADPTEKDKDFTDDEWRRDQYNDEPNPPAPEMPTFEEHKRELAAEDGEEYDDDDRDYD